MAFAALINDGRGGWAGWDEANAVDGARGDAKLAAGAGVGDDGVHELGAAEDGIHRAGLDALGAAYAFGLADDGHLRLHGLALHLGHVMGRRQAKAVAQGLQGVYAARWAEVDGGLALGQGFCVRQAAAVTAKPTLGLR